MAQRRERPIPRTNPSGERVWIARATDSDGRRHHLGTFKLRLEAQDAIDRPYQEWEKRPVGRHTVGEYAADWTQRHPRSRHTNYDRDSKLRQVLDVEIERRSYATGRSPSLIGVTPVISRTTCSGIIGARRPEQPPFSACCR